MAHEQMKLIEPKMMLKLKLLCRNQELTKQFADSTSNDFHDQLLMHVKIVICTSPTCTAASSNIKLLQVLKKQEILNILKKDESVVVVMKSSFH